MSEFNIQDLLKRSSKATMKFSEFLEDFQEDPKKHLYTSTSIISNAIRHFGYSIVVRSGEPVVSYNIFKDLFTDGVNGIYGQEFCIEKVLDVIDSANKEAYPQRGIVLVGPPASGKTNIVDMVSQAIEEYTKDNDVKLYTFSFVFKDEKGERKVGFRSSFKHNPIMLIPTSIKMDDGRIEYPRRELFNEMRKQFEGLEVPNYYKHSNVDKSCLDVIEDLMSMDNNKNKSLYDILEEYIEIDEIEFSCAQAKGISNIDEMSQIMTKTRSVQIASQDMDILTKHLPSRHYYVYDGSLVSANRGAVHIHDAFSTSVNKEEYRPLLMLLGSGKVAVQSTQIAADTSVFVTTNLEEMDHLEDALTSNKILDRIEKIPVNYLLDVNSEMKILERDMQTVNTKYDVDPNLNRISAYFSVLTRLFPTGKDRDSRNVFANWKPSKVDLFHSITPEQKLFIYAYQSVDPVKTIEKLPMWHPFRNEARKLGIDLSKPSTYRDKIVRDEDIVTLEGCGLFNEHELTMIDDDFMRKMIKEHGSQEGKYGISVRQMQNVMRQAIANSDGRKMTVNQFLTILKDMIQEGSSVHYWLKDKSIKDMFPNINLKERHIGGALFTSTTGKYGDYADIVRVVTALYHNIIEDEVTICTVDRDPEKIKVDLRRYVQYALLYQASKNKKFGKQMIEKYSFIDPVDGSRVSYPNIDFMESMERVLDESKTVEYRSIIADKFFVAQENEEITINKDKTILNSTDDGLVKVFSAEYNKLISHRIMVDTVDAEKLTEAFYYKNNKSEEYKHVGEAVVKLTETIVKNMVEKYNYSEEIALETIIYALKNDIVNFHKIIN
jgi:predicted Ser/Thr protein kinase